jgi:hypothetical protein
MTFSYVALGAAALALAVAGCGHQDVVEPTATSPEATVTVRTEIVPGHHGEMFFEGAVPEIRLVGHGGTLAPAHDHDDSAVFRHVPPGRYRLVAVLRPCDGNCGTLDGPTGGCSHPVHVREDGSFEVSWHVGSRCRVARVSSSGLAGGSR